MKVTLENGQKLNFPDDMSQDEISAAIDKNFPEFAAKRNLPSPAPEDTSWSAAAKKVGSDIGRGFENLGKGAVTTLANIGETTTNLPYYGERFLRDSVGAGPNQVFGKFDSRVNEALNNNPSKLSMSDRIMQGAPEFATSIAAPEASFGRLASASKSIPYLGNQFGKLLEALQDSQVARQVVPQALIAGSQAPEGDKMNSALMAAGLTGALNNVPNPKNLVNKMLSSLSPLKPQELQDAARVTQGTDTNLGSVLDNSTLKKQYENVIANIPMSGANQAMQKTAETIKNRGTDILNQLSGGADTSNVGQTLKAALNEAKDETLAQKTAKFKLVNNEAEKAGVKTNLKNYKDVAQEELDKINASPQLSLHADPAVVKTLKGIVEQKPGEETLENADFLRAKMGSKASEAFSKQDDDLSSIYTRLKKATQKDIDNAIDTSGNDKLKDLRDDAHNFYKKEWVPYKDPAIKKFTREGGDSDLLMQSFIKNSKMSDRANLLDKLTSKLQPQDRDLLAHSYFSNAISGDGQFDPLKFKTLYKQLGDRTKSTLFDNNQEMIKNLDDFTSLIGKNTKGLNLMLNPMTGAQNTAQIPYKSYIAGSALGGPLGGLGSVAGTMAAGRIGSTALGSEGLREGLIKQIIKAKQAQKTYANVSPFVNALMQSTRKDKENQ